MTTKTSSVLPPPGLSNSKKMLLEQRLRGARQQERTLGIPRRADSRRAPLSFAQQRLWFLDQLEPNSPMYNMPVSVRVRGPLEMPALERAINAIVARHEMLRTRFVAHEGEPMQEVMPASPVKIEVIDLRAINAAQREAELMRRLREVARQPFDISRDLLLRPTLIQLDVDDHALMINMHHIASDAWSFGVFFEELRQFYDQFADSDAPKVPELPIQYGDFAAWQRTTLAGDTLRAHGDYWRKKLAGAPELLELPTDHPRPAVQTFRGAHEILPLPAQLVANLRKMAQQNRSTPFMVLAAAFKTLLHRYCRQDDLMIGSPIAGRTQIETEKLIGFFINTLVLRTDFSSDPTFLQLLEQVRTTTLEAYAHQDMPFEKLVEELRPERTSSYSPLVQAMFVLQNGPAPNLKLGSATLEYIDVDTSTSKFDLVLSLEEAQGTLVADLEYNADLFEAGTVKRLLRNFVVLLEGIVADPQKRVSELPLLTETDRELLASWNETEREYPREASVTELFERVATANPQAIAVVDGAIRCTYAQLNEQANNLAHHLQQAGVKEGTPVAVYLERGLPLIVTFLAILKAGGAYVPLDRSYPKDRITFMIEDTQAPVLITTRALREDLPSTSATVLCIDKTQGGPKTGNVRSDTNGESLAYIIYTSGSTGRPKGVCVPHRAIARLVLETDYAQLTRQDVMAQISNCSFDAATWEIWGTLLNGGRLVIFPSEVLLSVRDFAEYIARHEVTALFVTTALFNQIAAEAPTTFRKVRHVLFGGEAADPKWAAEILRQGAPERLLNVYGPTETTTFATWHRILDVPAGAQTIPIGKPIANTTAWVLDRKLNLAPIGVAGELYIGGDGVGLGYLNRPELTAEKFITHPTLGRLYRTGDLVKRLSSGDIDFLGRIDEQVKIRGFRVEPGEIENLLSKHPDVSQCVVIARKDAAGSKLLVGYFAPKQMPGPTVEELRSFLKARLPVYMVPAFLVSVPHLPLTPNGKIDRKALPEPEAVRGATERKRLEPRDLVEQRLQEIWQNVLGVPSIGVQDRFFDLGGHSLLALRLIAQIEKRFSRKLPVTAVFQSPTIEQLAAILRGGEQCAPANSLVEIRRGGKRPPLVLVHGVGSGMFWGYSNLARHLDPEQPVFAFKSRGMDGEQEYGSIEEMAAHYVADLRRFQPRGPYYLGGYCFGGVVAYEMARRLHADGEHVALLALLNSSPPNSSYTRARFGAQFAARFVTNLGEWFVNSLKWTAEERRLFLQWKWRLIRKHLPGGRRGENGEIDEWVDLSPFPDDQKRLWEAHLRALMKYHPKPYPGHVTLFRSKAHQLMSSYDPKYGWGDYAMGGVTVKIVPGAHESIVEEPNVRELGRELSGILEQIQSKVGTYPELFREQARKSPSAIAVRHEGRELSYAELDRRSDLVAGFLHGAGIGPESIVGVALPRSIDFTIAVLGVMKAGGAYLPLDLSHPAERLAYFVSDSGAKIVLVVDNGVVTSAATAGARVVPFEEACAGPMREGPMAGPDNLAYVMYTSGSTGAPKGVQITHRSLLNHNLAVASAFELSPSDRVLQFAALTFDLSIEEIFPTWLRGGTLVLRPANVVTQVARFLEFVARENITILDLPTAYWHELVDACKGKSVPQCVRLVVIGGEQATFERLKAWSREVGHGARLINTYGPTETTVTATMYEATPERLKDGVFPIGKPIANTSAHVLDQQLQPVAAGTVGELYIGGAGVARGYLNRPELTKERFVAHDAWGRLYRTGDLVRQRPDGNLEFLGRVDNQIKVSGFRVEPGEIESAMRQHPAVRDAVVTQRQGRLVGYYSPTGRCNPAELTEFLREKLPDYMVPAAFVALESFPLTPNGKVDRAALPAPEFARPDIQQPFIPPESDVENKIASIWCDVLGLDRVGARDNFFQLGGHSLQAMQVISRMECELGSAISVQAFFENPTVAALAATKSKVAPAERKQLDHDGPLPLSFAQQRLWFLDQLQPNSPVYNIPQPIRLKGALRPGALERALDEIVRRHEALRTTYPTIGDSPVQQINPERAVGLRNVNLQHLPATERESALHRELVTEAQKPFNLREDLMLRALLVQLEPEENVLLLTIHHIAADAWSLGVILNELATLYNCFSKGQPSPLPELPAQYRHFALQQHAQAADLEKQLAYWKQQLAQAPSLFEWPSDAPRPALQSHRGGSCRFGVPAKTAERLRALAQQQGCTTFMTLLAAFQTLAFRWTGREDVVTGSAIANRNRPEFEPLVGFFVNTLPLRTRLEPGLSFRQLLERVRRVTIEAYDHQDVPFDKLVEQLQPERDTSYQPLIQTMFIQLNVPMPEIPGSGLTWLPFELDFGQSRFDLTLEMNETARGLEGRIEYAADLFEAGTIARMAAQYKTLLDSIIANPDAALCEVNILPDTERKTLLDDWNKTSLEVPREQCLHSLFEEQARNTPQAIAVIKGSERLTYQGLDSRANAAAEKLRQLGAGPEKLVAICLDRNLELASGILGVLKSGAAYVALDPTYPKERIEFMLNDSKATIVLTERKFADRFSHKAVFIEDIPPVEAAAGASPARPNHLAYIIYTSGSTGRPKGVAVEHRSAVNLVAWAKTVYSPEELEGVLACTSLCFDLSVFELFVPLCLGGKVIIAENALELPGLAAAAEVRLVNTVPSAMTQLLDIKGIPQSVRVINLAGEPLTRQLADRIYAETNAQKVYDLYGPTEDTVYATFALRKPGGPATIGRPLANNKLYILSSQRQLAPIGVPGELYIGGEALARGYLDRPDFTAERFVPDPFSPQSDARMYRTGDLARYLADGNVEFLGRLDHQVKIRGFRIELGEIEELLRQHPRVREAVVTARDDRSGDKRLLAYVTARNGHVPRPAELTDWLNEKLPDYMVPRLYSVLDTFPLTANGKIDRKALPEPDILREPDTPFKEPTTEIEKLLASIWCEVLELETVGINDNFFKLGGHSLKITQVISRVREALDVELPMRAMFEAPTIASLALRIEELLIQELNELSEEEARRLNERSD